LKDKTERYSIHDMNLKDIPLIRASEVLIKFLSLETF